MKYIAALCLVPLFGGRLRVLEALSWSVLGLSAVLFCIGVVMLPHFSSLMLGVMVAMTIVVLGLFDLLWVELGGEVRGPEYWWVEDHTRYQFGSLLLWAFYLSLMNPS